MEDFEPSRREARCRKPNSVTGAWWPSSDPPTELLLISAQQAIPHTRLSLATVVSFKRTRLAADSNIGF